MASFRRYKAYFDYFIGRADFLFVHIPKNAGVAVKKSPMLQRRLVATEPWFYRSGEYYRKLLATMKADNQHHGIHHARLRDVHSRVRAKLQPVAVIRNPWARVVSRYRFALDTVYGDDASGQNPPPSFEEFLEQRHQYGGKQFYWHRAVHGWYPQHDYVVGDTGEIEAHLLRHEHLEQEMQQYFGFRQEVRPRNVTHGKSSPYQEYYDTRTIQIVADWYSKDIEVFGFEFDRTATKNFFFAERKSRERLPKRVA